MANYSKIKRVELLWSHIAAAVECQGRAEQERSDPEWSGVTPE